MDFTMMKPSNKPMWDICENDTQKALNYLRDAITVNLPNDEIARRARLLINAHTHN